MRRFIAKNIGFYLQDKIKGTQTIDTYEFLQSSQYWDKKRIEEYQLEKLKKLVKYASENVPYYIDLFKAHNVNFKEIKSLNDIQRIPVLTKDIMRHQGDRLLSIEQSKFKIKRGMTGGTTGAPVKVFKDEYNRSFTWGSYYRWFDWMDINYYDTTVTFWGARTVLSSSFKNKLITNIQQYLQNDISFNSFELTESKLEEIVIVILRNKPVLIKGYLSALIDLANFLVKKNLKLDSLKAISSTTETLLPHNREYLEQVFGVPIFDQYGCGEVSAISYECSEHNGLHINQEHVICEILGSKGEPLTNQSGRIVATDLDNFVMPLIRFDTGDLGAISDKTCNCGVNQPLMTSIEGRAIDTIILKNGVKVHGVFFTDILFELKILSIKLQRFQIYQNIPGEIEFRIEKGDKLSREKEKKLKKAMLKFLNKVNILRMEKLPVSASGKFKYIVSEV
jgi:phenylacetate-CoA ligase